MLHLVETTKDEKKDMRENENKVNEPEPPAVPTGNV